VDVNTLKSAFLPFGDIVDISLPMNYANQKHKGFAFIEYQFPEDASDAIDNMDNGEIYGKTIRVNLARPSKFRETNNKPIWADDEYLQTIHNDEEKVDTNTTTVDDQEETGVKSGSDHDGQSDDDSD